MPREPLRRHSSGRAPLLACHASTADLVASGRSPVCRARACRTEATAAALVGRPGTALAWRARSGRPVGHAACVPCLRKPCTQVRGSRCHREYAGFSHRLRGHNGRRAWPLGSGWMRLTTELGTGSVSADQNHHRGDDGRWFHPPPPMSAWIWSRPRHRRAKGRRHRR